MPTPAVEYFARTWTTDDGLPHNSTSCAIQDSTGFMWFATVGGLARFDGREFHEFLPPAEYRPEGFNIRGLAEEKPGTLVVLPTDGSVLRLTGKTWSVHPLTALMAPLANDPPRDLYVDREGNVWVTTARGRLLRWQPDGTTKYFDQGMSDRPRSARVSFAVDRSRRLWIAQDSRLSVFQEGELKEHVFGKPELRVIGGGASGRIWICTQGRLQKLEEGQLVTVAEDVPWRGEVGAVRQVFEDSRGNVWMASSRRGLFRYADGQFSHVETPNSGVLNLMEDREGNIWVGTEGGVGELREKAHQRFNQASGLPQEPVNSIAADASGGLWLANRGGGLAFLSPEGRIVPNKQRTFTNVVVVDAQQRVWFGGGNTGLSRWRPETETAPLRMPVPKNALHLLFQARNGDMWFASFPGDVGYYRDDTPRILTAAEGMTANGVDAIAEDSRGHIWLGGRSGGLLRWDGRVFEKAPGAEELTKQPIHAISIDDADRIWIGTVGALVVRDGERFSSLTRAHGLEDDIIQGIVEDEAGRMWFMSRRGLFYVAKNELLAVVRGEAGRVTSHVFGRDQGLVGVTPVTTYYPTTSKSRDGRLWFATGQGAIAVDPQRIRRDLPPPPVLIDEVRLDGVPFEFGERLRIPSGRHRVEFRLVALGFTDPENVKLRHRLEGAESQWIDTGSERTAGYTNLPPGDYRLHVVARSSAGLWNAEGATLAFTVVPAWWETIYFRACLVALLVGLTAWLARTFAQRRLRLKLQRLEQDHALEKERVRIARDLHDDLGARLTEVGLLADRLVRVVPREFTPQLSGLSWRTRRLATELSSIIWTMSARNSSLDRLAEFLRRYAERLFRTTGTNCSVKGVDRIPAVPLLPEPQHQILAAAKEAMNNIIKHARATEVTIELLYVQGVFEVTIADNGVGFASDVWVESEGNGLPNMQSRLKETGGSCEVTSAVGRGTRVVLRLPCGLQPAVT